MHRSKTLVVILFLGISVTLMAQEPISSSEVESRSYQLYLDKNWGELILFGTQAVDDGNDYFYLRLRLGIAYFEKHQYRLATSQFIKALEFNSLDELTQEYLYYSLIYSDRYDEARKLSLAFGDALAKKLNQASWSSVDLVYAEGGAKISSRSDLFNPAVYFQAGLRHTMGNQFSVFHAATVYGQTEKRGRITQLQYFIEPAIPLGNQWTLTPSLHVVGLNFQKNGGFLRSTDLVGSLKLTKAYPGVEISVGGTISDVLSTLQYIQQSSITFYPAGKPNFSFGAISYVHSEDNLKSSTVAISPFIYWRPSGKIRLYFSYFANKNENLVELNGYLVNNSPDLTLSRTSGTASISLSRHLDLYGTYQYETKLQSNSINYSYSNFFFGLKFKP